jgi:large subunit ribosomal protein L30
MTTQQTVKVQLVRSPIGTKESPRDRAWPGSAQAEQRQRTAGHPEVRGMINKIAYLVKVL